MKALPHFLILNLIFTFGAVSVFANSDPKVDSIARLLWSQVDPYYIIEEGEWTSFKACDDEGQMCLGGNPAGEYGAANFALTYTGGNHHGQWRLKENESIVLILRTPPEMRYFGFTPYLMTRLEDGVRENMLSSLTDTLNLLKFKTDNPGDVFNSYAVLIMTADSNQTEFLTGLFSEVISSDMINEIHLPGELPLNLGRKVEDDTFGLMLRLVMPTNEEELEEYMSDYPVRVFRLLPRNYERVSLYPAVGYAIPGSDVPEPAYYEKLFTSFIQDLQYYYGDSYNLEVLEDRPKIRTNSGYQCIAGEAEFSCLLDNQDALYTEDYIDPGYASSPDGISGEDFIMVAGVNHYSIGRALFSNLTVYDEDLVVMAYVTDMDFVSSASYHAGRLNSDLYKNLYAMQFSFNCQDREFCVELPVNLEFNQIGILPGATFSFLSRIYVDPLTGLKPAAEEYILHKIIIARQK